MLKKIRTATYLFPITFIFLTFICFGLRAFEGMSPSNELINGSTYDLLFSLLTIDPLLIVFFTIDIISLVIAVIIFITSLKQKHNYIHKVLDIMALVNASLMLLNIILSFCLPHTIRLNHSLFTTDLIYIPDIFFALAIITYIYSLFVPRIFFRTRIPFYKLCVATYLAITLILSTSIFIICGTSYLNFNLKTFVSSYQHGLMFLSFIAPIIVIMCLKTYFSILSYKNKDKFDLIVSIIISGIIYIIIPFIELFYQNSEFFTVGDELFNKSCTPSNTPLGFGGIMLIVMPLLLAGIEAFTYTSIYDYHLFEEQSNSSIRYSYYSDKILQYNLLANFNRKSIKPKNKSEATMIGVNFVSNAKNKKANTPPVDKESIE